jgi:hypothetical protein
LWVFACPCDEELGEHVSGDVLTEVAESPPPELDDRCADVPELFAAVEWLGGTWLGRCSDGWGQERG